MKIAIQELTLTCKRGIEHLRFEPFSFFYGKMGAGKSTIVRLVDFCLGGTLEMTPALQTEFVAATLTLILNDVPMTLSRQRDSAQVEAAWVASDGSFQLVAPARKANGELLPGTGVEVLSDLLLHVAGIRPPRVRKSKARDDSELVRLSFRDLLWYCYLDQDTIDSSFFYLEKGAEHFRQLKSRDVVRYMLGYHQERVSEMENDLEEARQHKVRAEEGARALARALTAAGFGSGDEIAQREAHLRERASELRIEIDASRNAFAGQRGHAIERLRERGRKLTGEIQAVEDASAAVERVADNDRRHRNELITLSMKFRRSADARAVLSQVEFVACPRCTQTLPSPQPGHCRLCAQMEPDLTSEAEAGIDVDVAARIAEIEDVIDRHIRQQVTLRRDLEQHLEDKRRVDRELDDASRYYDSAYLSSTLQAERDLATVEQQVVEIDRARQFDRQRDELAKEAAEADIVIASLRSNLAEARAAAERDTKNLRRLECLFLDCLVRARVPGFTLDDTVSIAAPNFFPEVTSPGAVGTVVTTFAHLGSGGKKTLFKCCFAVALHRLSTEIGASLPTLLMIDTAMKNISERENLDQFTGFYSMLYELADVELCSTQFIVVDKEFFPPPPELEMTLVSRFMTPEDGAAPPLIRYYRGH